MNDNLLKPEGGRVIGEIPYVYDKPSTLLNKFTEQTVKHLGALASKTFSNICKESQEKTESARHKAQLVKNCKAKDFDCRPVQRQALLQWGLG